jgi:hypothetical protein
MICGLSEHDVQRVGQYVAFEKHPRQLFKISSFTYMDHF